MYTFCAYMLYLFHNILSVLSLTILLTKDKHIYVCAPWCNKWNIIELQPFWVDVVLFATFWSLELSDYNNFISQLIHDVQMISCGESLIFPFNVSISHYSNQVRHHSNCICVFLRCCNVIAVIRCCHCDKSLSLYQLLYLMVMMLGSPSHVTNTVIIVITFTVINKQWPADMAAYQTVISVHV